MIIDLINKADDLATGCHSYIGPLDYPEGSASLIYVTHFFYEWHIKQSSVEGAHRKAAAHDEETGMHQLYRSKQQVGTPQKRLFG